MKSLSQLQLLLEREKIKREEAEFVLESMTDLQKKSTPAEIISELQIILERIIPFDRSFIFSVKDHQLISADGLSNYPTGNLVQRLVKDKSVSIIYQTMKSHELPFLGLNGSAILFTIEESPENIFLVALYHSTPGQFSHRSSSVIKKLSVLIYEALVRVTHIKNLEKLNQEIVEKQQQLITSAKFITIGEIAAGVAHEINNPLAIISGRTEHLQRALKADVLNKTQFATSFTNILDTVSRIKSIVDALLHLSQGGATTDISNLSVQKSLDEVLTLYNEKMRSLGIQFELIDHTPHEVYIKGSRILISQVLMNLISNALYEAGEQKNGWIKIAIDADKTTVSIRVMNSGKPIDQKYVQKIFQPFFTTRPVGKGVGVGLSIAKKYVEQHHGELIYSYENDCINFIVKLPKAT